MKLDDLKAELSHQICHGPDNECTHCIAISQAVDYLAKNGYLAALNGDCGGGEPVAWQVYNELVKEWTSAYADKHKADQLVKDGYKIRPLYASLTADNAKRGE